MLDKIIDFENIQDLREEKTPQQAFGLYVVSMMVMLILFALFLMIIEASGDLEADPEQKKLQIESTGWFIGLLLSVPLAIIIHIKKKLAFFSGAPLVLLAFLLSFLSGVFALAIPAFMSTMEPQDIRLEPQRRR